LSKSCVKTLITTLRYSNYNKYNPPYIERKIAMSSVELICALRQRLLVNIEKRSVRELNRLNETFAALREIAHAANQVALLDILTDLEYAAGYAAISRIDQALLMIPTEDTIRAQIAGGAVATV
jgi:hypothetical protein